MSRGAATRITWSRSVRWCLAVGLAWGDQRRLTGNGSALEVVPRRCAIQIHDFTFYFRGHVLPYKLRNNIKSLSWPAQSPDLNIIENVWLRLKNTLQRNTDAITCVEQLKAAITTAWTNVPNNYIHWMYNSIPRHLRAVLTSKGNITKY